MINKNRLPLLDTLRGFALMLMVIFHFCFDLNHAGAAHLDLKQLPWVIFRSVILVLFLGLAGAGFSLGKPSYGSHSFWKRLFVLAACAAAVSAGTYILFPDAWVFFGVLHLILLASLLSPLWIKFPTLCLAVGTALLVIPAIYSFPEMHGNLVAILGLNPSRPRTVDFDPLAPWLGVILIGVFLGHLTQKKQPPFLQWQLPWLSALGRHTLLFYMVHQAVLLPLAWLIKKLQ